MSINHLLDVGRSALLAAQFGLDVTANNIANVNTPNYCRQRVVYAPGVTVSVGRMAYGSGVAVEGVERVYDAFLGHQVYQAYSEAQDYQLREQTYRRIESVLYPSEESNLGNTIDEFFNALHDLAGNPAGPAERQAVLAKADELAESLRSLAGSLDQEKQYMNVSLEGYRDEVNRVASEIAQINQEILRVQGPNYDPNDLMDRRDALIEELSGYVDPTVIENEQGLVTVLVSGGQPLVEGARSYDLELVGDPDDHGFYRVYLRDADITDSIRGGRIRAVLESRDRIAGYSDELDRIAAALANELNRVHTAGYDLEGNPGVAIFTPLGVTVEGWSTNRGGGAAVSQEITDAGALTLDDYEIRFTDSSTFDIIDTTLGTVVASGQAYTSGSPIEFDGLRIVLADGSGPPASGDRFRVSVVQDMARRMEVQVNDPSQIAAAQDPAALPGDNRNALAMADLRNARILAGGTATFGEAYHALVGAAGAAVQEAERTGEAKAAVYESMADYRDSVSGVSLEEEEIRLLSYQHAYQAATRFMSVVDELLDELIQI